MTTNLHMPKSAATISNRTTSRARTRLGVNGAVPGKNDNRAIVKAIAPGMIIKYNAAGLPKSQIEFNVQNK